MPPAASEAATQAAAAAPKYTQGSALDAYLEATRSAKKGFKAPAPEPAAGSSVQDSLSSAQEAASSAISSLTEGGSSPLCLVEAHHSCAFHLVCPFAMVPAEHTVLLSYYCSVLRVCILCLPAQTKGWHIAQTQQDTPCTYGQDVCAEGPLHIG